VSGFALTFIELDVDYCSLTYGTSPCTAALGVTGSAKCYNTLISCQDSDHFTNAPVTLRFGMDTGFNPDDIECIPNLTGVTITPGRISLGVDLGQRESVSINFKDHPYSDTGPGFDKYLADRSYDPFSQGTFWGKFRARQPYLKGRAVRIYRGFLGQALADMECRHYIVDSFTGPDSTGNYTIVAKDILKLLDGDIAQAPALSQGSLAADITSSATSATLSPTGIGSSYPTSGKIAIGGAEIVSFTRSGDTLTITAHGLNGTTASAHNAGDRCQVCLEYSAQDPAAIVYDLMVTYGGIDSSLIPLSTWETETDTFNRRLYSAIIAEPTSVRTLINEMIVQAGLAIWWDPVLAQVYLQALRAVTATAQVFDESVIMGDGPLTIADQPDTRVSEVWVYFGQRNPLVQQDLPSNYRSNVVVADLSAEANYGSAAIQTIYSRWIAFGGLSTAQRIGNMQLGRYVNPPRLFTFSMIREEDGGLTLGAGYYIENVELQNFDGSRATVPVQITRDNSQADRHAYEAVENAFVSYDSTDTLTIVIDSNIRSINLRSLYDSLYTAPQDNDTVTFIVNAGVLVGSTSIGLPAINVGSWPSVSTTGTRTSGSPTLNSIADTSRFSAGMIVYGTGIPAGAKIVSKTSSSITLDANATSGSATSTALTVFLVKIALQISGRVQGRGGRGGNGANGPAGVAGNGENGGTALLVRYGIDITINSGGKLGGGGGGGGGAGTRIYSNHAGGGGGGGAGDGVGGGGAAGSTGPAANGGDGRLDSGGGGGSSWSTNGAFGAQPGPYPLYGGDGGAPGSSGGHGGNSDSAGGTGGSGGPSIDGTSYVKLTNSGTILGSEVN